MHEAKHPKLVLGDNPEDRVGRVVGGGFRMGNTCKSMADSCQCMANHYNIVK